MRSALNATHAELKKNISQGSAQSSNYSISDVKVEFEKQANEIILKKLSASAVTSAATSKSESKVKTVQQKLDAQRLHRASRTVQSLGQLIPHDVSPELRELANLPQYSEIINAVRIEQAQIRRITAMLEEVTSTAPKTELDSEDEEKWKSFKDFGINASPFFRMWNLLEFEIFRGAFVCRFL